MSQLLSNIGLVLFWCFCIFMMYLLVQSGHLGWAWTPLLGLACGHKSKDEE